MLRIIRTGLVAALTLLLSACSVTEMLTVPAPQTPTVMITGSNRGIGFELAKQYAERGWGVIATCRNPSAANDLHALEGEHPNVIIAELDVADPDSIARLAAAYEGVPIDVLINNAGILGGNERQKFGTFDYAAFDDVMEVNTKGPIRMVEAFVDNVAASEQKKIMNITSIVGSIKMTFPGQNFYRASKAALNMSMATIAKELRYSDDPDRKQIIVGLIHPGVVKTDFAKNVPIPMIEPEESAAGIITVIDSYTSVKQSGDFMSYDGKELPW
ncbi:MAG: SDR family oxidoreductase [Gammaproteobacteria bacterium]